MSGFDIVTELGSQATTLVAVVGGAIAAALAVTAVSAGASLGISKFLRTVRKG